MGGLIMKHLLCSNIKNKIGKNLLLALLFSITLYGCNNVSDEKLMICKDLYNDVVEKHNDVIKVYSSISSDQFDNELNAFQEELNGIGEYNLSEMDDNSIDLLISDLKDRLDNYDKLLSEFNLLDSRDKHIETPNCFSVTFVNNTGLDLYELYFYNISKDNDRINLLSNSIDMLSGYGTFSIINIYADNMNTVWKLEVMDESGNVIESQEIDFSDYNSNITINMEFSFDTMEGWLEIN